MRDDSMSTSLQRVEEWYEPDPQFVEVLADELRVAIERSAAASSGARPTRRSRSPWLWSGVVAGLAALIGFGLWGGEAAPEIDPPIQAEASQPIAAVPRAISPVCERLVFAGAAQVGAASGQTQPVSYRVSSPISEALILDMRESLGMIAESYAGNPDANPVMAAGLSASIREFGLAALYLEMGEVSESQRHLDRGRETLAALQADPFFASCFGL